MRVVIVLKLSILRNILCRWKLMLKLYFRHSKYNKIGGCCHRIGLRYMLSKIKWRSKLIEFNCLELRGRNCIILRLKIIGLKVIVRISKILKLFWIIHSIKLFKKYPRIRIVDTIVMNWESCKS